VADIIFIVIVLLLSYIGFKRGFIRTLMGILSTVLSLVVSMVMFRPLSAVLLSSPLGEKVYGYVEKAISENAQGVYKAFVEQGAEVSTKIIIDAISFILVIVLAKIIISILAKALNLVSKLPVIHQANKILGLVSGVISGIIVCYIIVGVSAVLPPDSSIVQMTQGSVMEALLSENNIITQILT
jgi:uncharacterized membrane protein required for colicin V production